MKSLKLISALFGLAFLAGCFSTEEPPTTHVGKKDTAIDSVKLAHVLDSVRTVHLIDSLRHVNDSLLLAQHKQDTTAIKPPVNGNNGGWDDFPNKYKPTLTDLATNAPALPVPMGTRYGAPALPGSSDAPSKASAGGCTGNYSVYGYDNGKGMFIKDTIVYHDSLGGSHCAPQPGGRASEDHNRYVMDLKSGESWEMLKDSITDQDVLPKHNIHGTGHVRLSSGLVFTIKSYDVSMLTSFGNWDAYVLDASMTLAYKDGYDIQLKLSKPHPYKSTDFFPVTGTPPETGKIMSGPITKATATGVDTLGFMDLYSDRTLAIRDWKGDLVKP
jgi:hypothetical protein